MNKILLSTLLFAGLALNASAQDQVEIYEQGQSTDLSSGNGELTKAVYSSNLVTTIFEVKNISGSDKTWSITRYRVDEVANWEDYMCWYNCYTASAMNTNPWESPDQLTISDQSNDLLFTDVTPDSGTPGSARYRYYVTDVNSGDYVDSVDLVVAYTLGLETPSNELSLEIAPNPASDKIAVKANGITNAELTIVDVLGNVVYNETITQSKNIDVSEFNNGIYFVRIREEGAKPISRKIIVRH